MSAVWIASEVRGLYEGEAVVAVASTLALAKARCLAHARGRAGLLPSQKDGMSIEWRNTYWEDDDPDDARDDAAWGETPRGHTYAIRLTEVVTE